METHVPAWQDYLGKLVEEHSQLFVWLGNLETRFSTELVETPSVDQPIYVAGLARSGSTILLEMLAAHADVVTHKYRDFPVIHAPLMWNWFCDRASRSASLPVERAHKDRIMITDQSPEAMEEVLWMAFFPGLHDPAQNNALGEDCHHPEFENFYRDHIRKLLLLRRGSRYLSKGNYNITRLKYIRKMFPDARFIIPVRHPVTHIASLVKQHRIFCEEERKDPRVLHYMRRSGHYEFGLNRSPIHVGQDADSEEVSRLWRNGDELGGWARYWAMLYGFAADLVEGDPALREQTCVVVYEDLCASPAEVLKRIYDHCGLKVAPERIKHQSQQISIPTYYAHSFEAMDKKRIAAATLETYERLTRLSKRSRWGGM